MSKPTQYTIHLLRTGETAWDADDRIIGNTDLPMTTDGIESVASALRSFDDQGSISLLVTSLEESNQQSSKLVRSSVDLKTKPIEALSNIGQGLWEGVSHTDLEKRCPSAYAQWRESPERIIPPEGESFDDAQDRLIAAITKATSKAKGENPSIMLILRPWAWVVVRCWLNEQKISNVWDQLDLPTQVESYQVTKASLEAFQRMFKASA